jgi:hypothetical protein
MQEEVMRRRNMLPTLAAVVAALMFMSGAARGDLSARSNSSVDLAYVVADMPERL